MNNNKIYVLIASNYNNLGDLLINHLLIKELTNFGEVYIDASGVPNNFKKHLMVNEKVKDVKEIFGGSFKLLHKNSIAFKIRKAKFTHFFSSPGPARLRFSFRTIGLLFLYTYLKYINIEVCAFGKDIKVENKLIWNIYKRTYNNIYVRSIDNLKKLPGKKDVVKFAPDLAFMREIESTNKKEIFCISLRGDESEIKISNILDVIKYLLREGYYVEIFYQVEEDYLINYHLSNLIEHENIKFIKNCLWFDDVSYYKDKKIVLSNRLHVLLLGMMHGAIPIAYLSNNHYSQKIKRIYNSIDMNKYIISNSKELIINDLKIILSKKTNIDEINKKYTINHNICKNRLSDIFI